MRRGCGPSARRGRRSLRIGAARGQMDRRSRVGRVALRLSPSAKWYSRMVGRVADNEIQPIAGVPVTTPAVQLSTSLAAIRSARLSRQSTRSLAQRILRGSTSRFSLSGIGDAAASGVPALHCRLSIQARSRRARREAPF